MGDILLPESAAVWIMGADSGPLRATEGGVELSYLKEAAEAGLLGGAGNRACSCIKGVIVDRKLFAISLLAAVPLLFVGPVAKADNIVTNQWYSAQFPCSSTCALQGPPYQTAIDGPVLPDGFADSINAPDGTSWTITLTGTGTLTVTDLEQSGDQFQMFDNGVAMTAASSPFTAAGQNSGQSSPGNGETSTPNPYVGNVGEDINLALGNPDFSSATFALGPGANDITGNFIDGIGYANMAFIAEGNQVTPEPSSLALFGTGLVGLLFVFRRKLTA